MRVLLVVNPRSRRGRRLGGAVRDELTRRGIEIVESENAGANVDAIVVAGGDGSFVRLIGRALELGVPMGLVPLGTFNDLARTLGIPFDVGEASAVIASGNTRRIDVARVNGAHYVNEASIGLSSRITSLQRSRDKQRFALGAILGSAWQALRYARPFAVEISFGGRCERLRAFQVTVANSHRFGGVITVEDAAIDDGLLDCYVLEGAGFPPLLALARAVARRRRPHDGAVRAFRSVSFAIGTRRPRRISADGEPAGRTPAAFEVLPAALRVFAPP
jgi:YegS/Rv2252/BmrU family lipid kinase